MKEKTNWVPRFWFPGRDGDKNPIEEDLAEAAREDCESLMEYAEQHSIDPAEAQNMVEALVEDLASKQQTVPASRRIKKPRSYLRTAFVRAINALSDKEGRVDRVAVAELERLGVAQDGSRQQDRKILVSELVSMMDLETRRTYWRRSEGYSWKEIARQRAVSVWAVASAYARGLQKVRETIHKRRRNHKQ
jgi:DNA-directed RNA polymerase specialized sigma24 family protein